MGRYLAIVAVTIVSCWFDVAARAAPQLTFAVLPSSRSIATNSVGAAFVSVTNEGDTVATNVTISLASQAAATLSFQTIDPNTSMVTGSPNVPVDIPPGVVQTFVIAITPAGPISPVELFLKVAGTNTNVVSGTIGVDTLLFSAAASPPDIVAVAATISDDGIVSITSPRSGSAAFAVATINLGAAGQITASADTGKASLPLSLSICQTDPVTSKCQAPAAQSAKVQIGAGATPTFGIFVTTRGNIPFDPVNNRVFVRFRDSSGTTRGTTSVAVRTIGTGTLQVVAVFEDNQTPAPGVYNVLVQNSLVGQTKSDGTLTIVQPAQTLSVRLVASGIGGSATVTIPQNGTAQVKIPVSSEGNSVAADLNIAPMTGGVVASNISSLTLSVLGVSVATVNKIFLQSTNLQSFQDVTSYFSLQANGTIVATNLSGLVSLIGQFAGNGQLEFDVDGAASNGTSFEATGQFNWGNTQMTGILKSSPSNPNVPVAGIPVTLTMGTLGVSLTATTDSFGNFSFPFVPTGTVSLFASSNAGGTTYSASGSFTWAASGNVTMTLLGLADIVNGVQPITLRSSLVRSASSQLAARQQVHRFVRAASVPSSTSVTATGGDQDMTSEASVACPLTAQNVTTMTTFTYNVQSQEYPVFVEMQSEFDDQWSVSVYTSDGQQLFTTGAIGVNSQLDNVPIWQPDGTTGPVPGTFAVPPNTNSVILVVTSVNIGDSLLPTTVTANCPTATPTATSLRFSTEDMEDAYKGGVKNISLPRPESDQVLATNVRHAGLKYTPADLTINTQSLSLQAVDDAGNTYQISPVVTTVPTPGTLQVETTFGFGNGPSVFAALSGPNTKYLRYRVQLNATTAGGDTIQLGPVDSKPVAVLWRADDVYHLTGVYGAGSPPAGTNWATYCTFNWLQSNISLLRPMNDISQHHGKKPFYPHKVSHTRGRDFDMFHIYQNDAALGAPGGPGTATKYYLNLQKNAIAFAKTSNSATVRQAAVAILRGWAQATRTGIDALFSAGASKVLYAEGDPEAAATPVLKAGWAQNLLLLGLLPDGTIDKTLGTWSPAGSFAPNSAHNNHVHVSLLDVQTNNGCDTSPQ